MSGSGEVDLTRGRFRRIYSTILTDAVMDRLSDGAESLWYRLHLIADDYGNLDGDPVLVRCAATPRKASWTPKKITAALAELQSASLLRRYQEGGGSFAHLSAFLALQPANQHGKRFRRFPQAPGEMEELQSGLFRGRRGEDGSPQEQTQVQTEPESEAKGEKEPEVPSGRRVLSPASSSDAGPGNGHRPGRTVAKTAKAFVDVGVYKLGQAFGLSADRLLSQRRAFAATLLPIASEPDREERLLGLILLAQEKRADPTLDNPIATWCAALKKEGA